MQRSEKHPAADRPDEDRLRLPAKWRRHVPPRRGRDLANTAHPTVALDPDASQAVAQRIEAMRPLIEEGIAAPANTKFAAAMTTHLQGRPDPAGAAALMHLLESTGKQTVDPAARVRHLDAWIADHGLAFAATATLESALVYNLSFAADDRSITGAHLNTYLDWNEPKGWRLAQPAAQRLRAFLATAAEDEYRDAVAAVEARRTDPARHIGSALLMPTERAWVEQAVPAVTGYFERRRADDWMVWSLAADPRDWDLVERRGIDADHIDVRALAPLIEGMGTAALPVLVHTMDRTFVRLSKPARAALMTAIGLLPADEATGHLVDKLALPGALTVVMEVAERFPVRTLRAIAARADDPDPEARTRLANVVKSSAALGEALAESDEPTREAIAALLDTADRVPDAQPAALPPLLIFPPWKGKRRKTTRPVVEDLAPALETRLVWGDAEEAQRWATLGEHDSNGRLGDKAEQRGLAYFAEHGELRNPTVFLAWATLEAAEPLVAGWDGTAKDVIPIDLTRLLGRFGAPVADRVAGFVKGRNALVELLMPIQGLAAARIAADWLARSRAMGPDAKRWFARHADAAAHLLIPDALGTDSALRRAATTALRYLIAVQGAESVATAAKDYGEAAAAAIDALIAADPLDPLDAKIPAPPSWGPPTMLPQVLLKGRKAALPPESVVHLTTVLALDSPELPYAGVAVVDEACDSVSLTRFSWALFELWTAVGAPSKDGWAFDQLAHFADDGTVAELAALIREWPGEGQHKRAVTGLGILGAIGTETSLRALHTIERKVGFRALKLEARRQIEVVAERLGLTPEQLADRLVPDFGLGGELSLVLDYGPRQFTVGFDERLQPFVTAADGKPLKRLPKPGAQDDAEVAEAAAQRFSALKKDLRAVAKEQVRRLERAMAAGRIWTVPQFREYFADHPLMWHLARRLVWLATFEGKAAEGERFAFRLAEDRTLTDVGDDACDLPAGALIRLAHPVDLGERLAAWAELLADYEILQPFEQLSRPVLAFTAEELRTGRLTRFEGASIAMGQMFGMLGSGWQRGPADNLWVAPGVHQPLPGGGFVVLALDPGIDGYLGSIDPAQPDQTVRAAYLSATANYDVQGRAQDLPTGIDPRTASEVLRTLTRITRGA